MAFEKVGYADGAVELTALSACPESTPRGAVAIYPTFMNSTPGVEAKAQALVDAGYAVLVGDFYGPESPADFDAAFVAMARLRSEPLAMRRRLAATLDLLRSRHPGIPHLAIGFCLGGMAVLEMARAGEDLLAVASFHGLIETALPAAKPITPRILVCHGDADAMVPRKQVIGFWEEMDAVKAEWHFHSYAGVEHGFTMSHRPDGSANPAHDASAERQSWAAMHSLFDEVLA